MAVSTDWYYSPWPTASDPKEPAAAIVAPAVPFSPTATAAEEIDAEPIRIHRSAGSPIVRFVPLSPFAATASQWSVRIGTRAATLVSLTSAAGLTVDENVGTITANPTAAQTAALPLDQVVWVELWRTGSGDDNTAPVVRRRATVLRSLT